MKQYEVYLNDNAVGQVKEEKVGLFTEFSCICHFGETGTFRIKAVYKNRELDLGICIPEGNFFAVNKKIPSKYLGDGEPMFFAINMQEKRGEFVPIRIDESFPHLSMLDKGRFLMKEAVTGIAFSNTILKSDHLDM